MGSQKVVAVEITARIARAVAAQALLAALPLTLFAQYVLGDDVGDLARRQGGEIVEPHSIYALQAADPEPLAAGVLGHVGRDVRRQPLGRVQGVPTAVVVHEQAILIEHTDHQHAIAGLGDGGDEGVSQRAFITQLFEARAVELIQSRQCAYQYVSVVGLEHLAAAHVLETGFHAEAGEGAARVTEHAVEGGDPP